MLTHDAEPDHEARRSPLTLVPYLLGQAGRARDGAALAECGNSGNSTQPHVHVQVSDTTDWDRAHGVPLAFRDRTGRTWVPAESEVVRA